MAMVTPTGCRYIDDYIVSVRSGVRPASKEMRQAVEYISDKLSDPGVVIDTAKTERARELIETYFDMTLMH